MKAMMLTRHYDLSADNLPLELSDIPVPSPGENEVLLKINTCGVCHTELDEIEGRMPPPSLPIIPGHQVVGQVIKLGSKVQDEVSIGDRVGVGWIFSACGHCVYCRSGFENLCSQFRATGRDVHGGYAEYMLIPVKFCFPIPPGITDHEAAPLLCAGAIGYRSLKLAGIQDGDFLGLMGFGASAHLVLKFARYKYPNSTIFVFSRSQQEQEFALSLGAGWVGEIDSQPPEMMKAIIDTTPAWNPVIKGLENLEPGGRLVINAIRKEIGDRDCLAQLDYPVHLWQEKEIKSIANVTRADISEFLHLAEQISIRPEIQVFPLEEANQALMELKNRKIRGAKVLQIAL